MKDIAIAVLVAVILSVAITKASVTESATLNVINSSVGINQNLLINFSVFSYNSSTYSLSINNKTIDEGVVPGNYAKQISVAYNVTNMMYGNYKVCLDTSILKTPLCSNTSVYIKPYSMFSFDGTESSVFAFNKTAQEEIKVDDTGNTPLNVTWMMPVLNGVYISMQNFKQVFQVEPNQTYLLPMNITITLPNATLDFPFQAKFNGTEINKTLTIKVIHPEISMKFKGNGTMNSTQNYTYYSISFSNGNNVPINVTFRFLLYIDGNPFLYNVTRTIFPGETSIVIPLPKSSTISRVEIFYPSSSGAYINQTLFYKPVSPIQTMGQTSSSVLMYIVLTIVVIALILAIYFIDLRRKK